MDSRYHIEDGQLAAAGSVEQDEFSRRPSVYQMRRLKTQLTNDWTGPPFEVCSCSVGTCSDFFFSFFVFSLAASDDPVHLRGARSTDA